MVISRIKGSYKPTIAITGGALWHLTVGLQGVQHASLWVFQPQGLLWFLAEHMAVAKEEEWVAESNIP
jgi:hypothetical protein